MQVCLNKEVLETCFQSCVLASTLVEPGDDFTLNQQKEQQS